MRFPMIAAAMVLVLARTAAHADPVLIVAFGGSNTFGKGLSREQAYPAQLERLLREDGFDVSVRNEGTNGQTTSEELGKLDTVVPNETRIVIFQPGGNDSRNGGKHSHGAGGGTQENIREIVSRLLARHVSVLVSGNDTRLAAIVDLGVPTIDEINRLAPDHFQPDQVHLTPEGYRIVAEKMRPIVEGMLNQLASVH